jgi:CheY-like chemotaxis protein
MGERILREEGYQVVSLTDGETAILRMADVDPDLVIADIFLPRRTGMEVCRYVKTRHRHARVILTAGLLEKFNEADARRAGCDAILRKPFEASVAMQTIRPLIQEALLARGLMHEAMGGAVAEPISDALTAPKSTPPDPKSIEEAVTLAFEAALPALVKEITAKVLLALDQPGTGSGNLKH